jgi:hypothetical protein
MANVKMAIAIRIYFKEDGINPVADIYTVDGLIATEVEWDKPDERNKYPYNAYTLWYDERPKRSWEEWVQ